MQHPHAPGRPTTAMSEIVQALEASHRQLALERSQRDELLSIEHQRMVVLQRMLGAASAVAAAGHIRRTVVQAALYSWRRASECGAHYGQLRAQAQRAGAAEDAQQAAEDAQQAAEEARQAAETEVSGALERAARDAKRSCRASEARATEAEAQQEAASETAEAEAEARRSMEGRLAEMQVLQAAAESSCADARDAKRSCRAAEARAAEAEAQQEAASATAEAESEARHSMEGRLAEMQVLQAAAESSCADAWSLCLELEERSTSLEETNAQLRTAVTEEASRRAWAEECEASAQKGQNAAEEEVAWIRNVAKVEQGKETLLQEKDTLLQLETEAKARRGQLHLTPSHPIPSHPTTLHPIPPQPHPIPSHPNPSDRIPTHRIPTHATLTPPQHDTTHPVPSHLIKSHPIKSPPVPHPTPTHPNPPTPSHPYPTPPYPHPTPTPTQPGPTSPGCKRTPTACACGGVNWRRRWMVVSGLRGGRRGSSRRRVVGLGRTRDHGQGNGSHGRRLRAGDARQRRGGWCAPPQRGWRQRHLPE